MPAPNLTQEALKSNKHYSFLNVLDDIATSSADLTIAPAFSSASFRQQKQEDAVKRLSETLQSLATNKYGYKQLPELPVPTYDNGNIDVEHTSCSTAGPRPALARKSCKARTSAQQAQKHCLRQSQQLPQISLDQSLNADNFADMFDHEGYRGSQSKRSSCYASNTPQNREIHLLEEKSRPLSMYSTSAARRVTLDTRPGSSCSTTRPSRARKKSITYDDQRACPPRVHDSPQPMSSSSPQPARRGFRLIASLKDLRIKADKRCKTEETVTQAQQQDDQTVAMMSLKEALRGVAPLSPLHDPQQYPKFAQECSKMLSLRRDASKCSFIAPQPVKQLPEPPQEHSQPISEAIDRPSMHVHRASEAMSVSTSILDWDWPRPDTYKNLHTVPSQDLRPVLTKYVTSPHCDADRELFQTTSHLSYPATSPHNDSFPKIWTAPKVEKISARSPPPSAPPERPLPLLPSTEVKASPYQFLKKSNAHRCSAVGQPPHLGPVTSPHLYQAAYANSRLSKMAAIRGLQVDSTLVLRADAMSQGQEEQAPKLPLSPLNLRSNGSDRNLRVSELKRRHLSMLVRGSINVLADELDSSDGVGFARRGSAPDVMETAAECSAYRRRISVDKRKPLPTTPGSRVHTRRSSAASTAVRQHAPNGIHSSPPRKSRRSKENSRPSLTSSATASKLMQKLSRSGVMTLVDSDPRAANGFRAAANSAVSSKGKGKGKGTASGAYKPARFHCPHDVGSEESRPASSQSSMSYARGGATVTVPITVPPSSDFTSSATAGSPNASLDSGYGSAYDAGLAGSGQGPAQEYMDNRSYAELLEDESRSRPSSPGTRTSNVLAKIEADLAGAPPRANSDSGGNITPSPSQRSGVTFLPLNSDQVYPKIGTARSTHLTNSNVSAPQRLCSSSSVAPSRSSAIMTTTIASLAQLPVKAGSTLLSASRFPPHPVASRRKTPTPHLKKHSILSQYNPYPSQQSSSLSATCKVSPSSTASLSAACVCQTIPGKLPQKQVAIGPNMPAADIDQKLDFSDAMPRFLTSTRQMDRAIDALQASADQDYRKSAPNSDARTHDLLRDHHSHPGFIGLRRSASRPRGYEHSARTSDDAYLMEEDAWEYESRTGCRPPV